MTIGLFDLVSFEGKSLTVVGVSAGWLALTEPTWPEDWHEQIIICSPENPSLPGLFFAEPEDVQLVARGMERLLSVASTLLAAIQNAGGHVNALDIDAVNHVLSEAELAFPRQFLNLDFERRKWTVSPMVPTEMRLAAATAVTLLGSWAVGTGVDLDKAVQCATTALSWLRPENLQSPKP